MIAALNPGLSDRTAEGKFYEGLEIATRQREELTVTEWANRNRYFAHGQSFKSQEADAKYSSDDAPFQREPQDALLNPDIQVHIWMMASRIAKTVMGVNALGYFSEHDPTTMIFMYPTQEAADIFSKDGVQPVIDVSPALRGTFVDAKGGSGDNTIAFKKFRGGSLACIGSNAPTKLRQRTARFVFGDEIDAYRRSSGKEGDPLLLLFNRTKNYRRPIKVIASTPTIKNHSAIDNWFQKSDQRKWFVKCQKCGEFQTLKWALFQWPKNDPSKCRCHCEACGYGHTDEERVRMIIEAEKVGGGYRPTAPFTGIRGYFLPGFYSIFPCSEAYRNRMHQFAAEFVAATHSQNKAETVRVLTNTFFCETYQEESDVTPDWKPIFDRREKYSRESLPNLIILITAGVDIQDDRIEVVFYGHGRDEEKWRIEKHVLPGDPRVADVWNRLENILILPFKREDGVTLYPKAVGIDTGNPYCVRQAYLWIRPRQTRNWFALKGASQIDYDVVKKMPMKKIEGLRLYGVGTNRIKALIYNRAVIATSGPNYIHFSKEMTASDFEQLFSEESLSVFKAGVQYKEFTLPGGKRNEELDCCVYAHAAFYLRGIPNYDREETANLLTIEKTKKGEKEIPPSMRPAARGGFGSGWNL